MIIDRHKLEDWYAECQYDSSFNISEHAIDCLWYSDIEILNFLHELEGVKIEYFNKFLLDSIRKNIALMYSTSPKNIVITNGASEAIFLLLSLFSGKGKNIVVQIPFYYDYTSFLATSQTELRPWKPTPSEPSTSYGITKIVDSNTVAILLNNPNNPTGLLFDLNQISNINYFCSKQQIYLIADEVGLPLSSKLFTIPSYSTGYNYSISIGSLSKIYGAPGLRCGWIVAPDKIINSISTYKDIVSIANCDISLLISNKIIVNSKHIDCTVETVFRNIEIVDAWLNTTSIFSWIKPFFSLSTLIYYDLKIPSYHFCKFLLDSKRVFTAPGSCFGVENSFRISLGCDSNKLLQCLSLISSIEESLCHEF